MTIVIGSDHAGFEMKESIKPYLYENFTSIFSDTLEDFGCNSSEAVDYTDPAHIVARAVDNEYAQRGVLICGSGQGVTMVANKYPNVRAALCWTPEIAILARQHNNANVLCLPARFLTNEQALDIVKAFFATEFSYEKRHENRIHKIQIKNAVK